MTEIHRLVDWKLTNKLITWLIWVIASTAAILVAFVILYASIFIVKAIVPGANEDRFMGLLMFPVMSVSLGFFQWLVLRTRIPGAGWWVLATGLGLLVAIVLAGILTQTLSRVMGPGWRWDSMPEILILYGSIGLLLALAQLPVLWKHMRLAGVWPLLGIAGWLALGVLMGKSIDRTSDILALGAVPAAFSGLGLLWLLPESPNERNGSG